MEISSNTSNIQPYGSDSGTKLASQSKNANAAPTSTIRSSERLTEQATELAEKRQAEAAEAAQEFAEETKALNEEQRAKMVEQMQEFVSSMNKGLSFRVDKESGREVMTIYEAETGDVIRQIPEEEMLVVLRRLAKEYDHRSGLVMTKV